MKNLVTGLVQPLKILSNTSMVTSYGTPLPTEKESYTPLRAEYSFQLVASERHYATISLTVGSQALTLSD